MTKSAGNCGFGQFTEEILDAKLYPVFSGYSRKHLFCGFTFVEFVTKNMRLMLNWLFLQFDPFMTFLQFDPSYSKFLVFSWFSGLKIVYRLLSSLTQETSFERILVILQHSSLTYCIPSVKDQSNFYEILSPGIWINIKCI